MSNFPFYLKNLIDRKKLNQSQVATYAGVSVSAVSLWLSGKRLPEPENLRKIAPVLGVSIEELMQNAGYLESESRKDREPTITIDATGLDAEDIEILEKMAERMRHKGKKSTA